MTRPVFPPVCLVSMSVSVLVCLLLSVQLVAAQTQNDVVFIDPPASTLLQRMYAIPAAFGPAFSSHQTTYSLDVPPTNVYGCSAQGPLPPVPATTVLLLRRGGENNISCTFIEKALSAQTAGAAAMIVINTPDDPLGMGGQADASLHIPSAMISLEDGNSLLPFLPLYCSVTGYTRRAFDPCVLLIFLLSVGTVICASIIAASKEREYHRRRQTEHPSPLDSHHTEDHLPITYVSVKLAVGFVFLSSISLVTLFFFISELIMVIIVLFCIGGAQSTAQIMAIIADKLAHTHNKRIQSELQTPSTRQEKRSITHSPRSYYAPVYVALCVLFRVGRLGKVRLYTLISLIPATVIAVVWFVYRQTNWSWVLQDSRRHSTAKHHGISVSIHVLTFAGLSVRVSYGCLSAVYNPESITPT